MSVDALAVVRDGLDEISTGDPLWLTPRIVVAHGYYHPGEFEDAREVPGLTSAWERLAGEDVPWCLG